MSEQAPTEGGLCWIEIPARDSAKLKDFYASVFPSWEFEAMMTDEQTGSKVIPYKFKRPDGLTGGILQLPADCPAGSQSMGYGFTNYYFVNDVDEAVARIEKLGGKVVLPKKTQGKEGLFANLVDIEGNRFGVYQWLGNSSS